MLDIFTENPDLLLQIALLVLVLAVIWAVVRIVLRLTIRIFTLGCALILGLGLCVLIFGLVS